MADFLQDKYINVYLDYLKYEKKLSENTIMSYSNDLKHFFIKNINYLNLKEKDLSNYIRSLNSLDRRSLAHHLTVLNSFYSFLLSEEIISYNPCANLKMPKITPKLPDYLTREEINKLLDIKLEKPNDYRNKAMLELAFASGLRVSELTNLKISDINFDDCYVRVLGKGSKERIVPIIDTALNYVKLYIDLYRNSLLKQHDSEYIFISSYGTKITRQAFFKFIKEECSRKNIKKEISPHTLRHSFASTLLKGGANIKVIQELLGHEDLKTTQIYTHLIDEKLKKDYEEFHPRSHKVS